MARRSKRARADGPDQAERTERTERPARPRGTARDRALVLLSVRWRSEAELRQRLRAAGFPDEEITDAIQGLDRAGLVDDARFAREVVRDQAVRRHASDRAIRSALWQKGVSRDVAEAALAESGEGEAERARALAESRAPRLTALGPDAAYRRLYGLLVRRGHAPSVARQAVRDALGGRFEPGSAPEIDPDG